MMRLIRVEDGSGCTLALSRSKSVSMRLREDLSASNSSVETMLRLCLQHQRKLYSNAVLTYNASGACGDIPAKCGAKLVRLNRLECQTYQKCHCWPAMLQLHCCGSSANLFVSVIGQADFGLGRWSWQSANITKGAEPCLKVLKSSSLTAMIGPMRCSLYASRTESAPDVAQLSKS